MEYITSEWNGFEMRQFELDGRITKVICPKEPREDKKWLLKTEYLDFFPAFEIEMLSRGYYVAYIQNITRWCKEQDTDARKMLCEFLINEFGFYPRCVPVGMSCGGMQAVYFASKYPQYVPVMYLDAPVLNLLSCPCGLGTAESKLYDEYFKAMGKTKSELLNFRDHPIDRVDGIIANNVPVFLVCGDSDVTVPYEENGMILAEKYLKSNVPFKQIVKKECGHWPHGLEDPTPVADFVEEYYK
ncbi:MAG: alpha/beta hydrolase [Clostridia bacterium]|nr:alpha/beta hydrolase [Clostridia bacterium]